MRTSFLLLGACVPIAACSADLVTAPKPAATTATTVIIRGASSLRGSSPIFIVDGVVVGRNDINPGDIESVEIIKGASATSLYGTMRCPAIVITTRRAPSASEPQPAIHEGAR